MNANPQRGEVDIVLDRPRVMVLNFKALAAAEKVGGFTMFNLYKRNIGVHEFRALGYAGLLKDDPKLTLEQFDELIVTEQNFTDLMKAVTEALELSFQKDGSPNADPQTPVANLDGTGQNS